MKTKNNNTLNKAKQRLIKAFGFTLMIVSLIGLESCEDTFLDVVPDNVATIEQAFKLRNEAEKYLFTCYSYLPLNGDALWNVAMLSGDELWIPPQDLALDSNAFDVARGLQRKFDPYVDAWEGRYQGGGPNDQFRLWNGIRHCNIFIENLEDESKVPDITQSERLKWIAEAKFLKAYYHFYMMRMYGPIPVMRKNIAIDAPLSELYVSREPVDEVVNYIVQLLDEATVNLEPVIVDKNNDLGRITKPVAAALKAQVLLTSASPLFNGNTDMAGFTTKDGKPFFNQTYVPEKWQLAADAAKAAIDLALAANHDLYTFTNASYNISDVTKRKLSITEAITDRTSREVIWHNTKSQANAIQVQCAWPVNAEQPDYTAQKFLAPTLKMAQMFYSKNGVPIEEDKTLDFSDIKALRGATASERFDIKEGERTARLNFDREPRFYADLAFDRSVYYLESSQADETKYWLRAKFAEPSGSDDVRHYNITGYYLKKLVNYRYNWGGTGTGASFRSYAWPEIRLAELYLDYAEALNEVNGPGNEEIFTYLDKIRNRAGLIGVKESWNNYSKNPTKHTTKDGLREIIHQERNIELCFEGKRFWDLKRWKKAVLELNQPIRGWNYKGTDEASYYQITTIFQQRFVGPRDYFWPINEQTIRQNPNLIQNPGW